MQQWNGISILQSATSGHKFKAAVTAPLGGRGYTWKHRNLDNLHFRTVLTPHKASFRTLYCPGLHTVSHHPHDLSPSLIPLFGFLARHSSEATAHPSDFPIQPFSLPWNTHRLNESGTRTSMVSWGFCQGVLQHLKLLPALQCSNSNCLALPPSMHPALTPYLLLWIHPPLCLLNAPHFWGCRGLHLM